MSRRHHGMVGLLALAGGLLWGGAALAGSLDPTNAPAPTMHTLEEIYQKVANLAPQDLQTLSATNTAGRMSYTVNVTVTP